MEQSGGCLPGGASSVPVVERERIGGIRVWRRRGLAVAAVAVAVVGGFLVVQHSRKDGGSPGLLVPRPQATRVDPLAFDQRDSAALEVSAAFARSHTLYAKSPGGVVATATRTDSFRPLIEQAAAAGEIDPDLLEAIVFLESGGRPNVIAGDDPARASGLTQIVAETGKSFLGMKVDLAESRRLTAAILASSKQGDAVKVAELQASRRLVDERFVPAAALAATVRYLETAKERVGADDLAVVSYHMGIGNLSRVIRAYARADGSRTVPEIVDDEKLSWVRIFFDTSPAKNISAYLLLQRLGDDSPSYYWRVLAAEEIMRLYRHDPNRLAQLDALQNAKASAEEVLHPAEETDTIKNATELRQAWDAHVLEPLPNDPGRLWFTVDPTMGELAPKLGQPKSLYRGLRPEALATLVYLAQRVYDLSGSTHPLEVTSSVRDEPYQDLLRAGNPEATHGYSLHTTGYAFDIRRKYGSPAQAEAFQYELELLRDRGLITWVREPAAIHITASTAAKALIPTMLERS